ncbi:hypothetical protein BIW11_02509 [Tropilaelaps mercedesae]|uniref:Uncharacterized protein n=1 Tax=Tropilaelaps mercedesae TaxID=418985 RepID=A0A1V9Y1W2_9ACAR|nr:hypothetical protein BIW11_02509 [Tropilaelaps mercedesae]
MDVYRCPDSQLGTQRERRQVVSGAASTGSTATVASANVQQSQNKHQFNASSCLALPNM